MIKRRVFKSDDKTLMCFYPFIIFILGISFALTDNIFIKIFNLLSGIFLCYSFIRFFESLISLRINQAEIEMRTKVTKEYLVGDDDK